jgi:hypothetical protein
MAKNRQQEIQSQARLIIRNYKQARTPDKCIITKSENIVFTNHYNASNTQIDRIEAVSLT